MHYTSLRRPLAPPVTIKAQARKLSNFDDVWTLPAHPEVVPGEGVVELELVPYGCSKVFKISMLPVV